jgi:BNR repeat protein
VDVLVAVKGADGVELRHQRSRDGGRTWGESRTIAYGPARVAPPRRGNDPQIAALGEKLIAIWTAPGTSRFGGGPFATALSEDGGATWQPGPNPADDGSTANHGFADLARDDAGRLHLVWLDAREGAQGLRATVSVDFGRTWRPNVTVDERTCECCLNRLATGPRDTMTVIYRDKGPRDMAVAVTADGGRGWTRAGVAGAFGWQFEGCPESGGALARTGGAAGATLHALVWTGAENRAGLYRLRSTDGGRAWTEPVRVGGEGAQRGDLAASGARLAVAWDEVTPDGRVVFASVSEDAGATWSVPERLTSGSANAAQPLLAATGPDRFFVAWTEAGPDGATVWRSRPL